jgi:hypothetical protein
MKRDTSQSHELMGIVILMIILTTCNSALGFHFTNYPAALILEYGFQ